VHAHRAQRVGQGRGADQIKGGVDAVWVQFAHGGRDLAGIEQGWSTPCSFSRARRPACRVVAAGRRAWWSATTTWICLLPEVGESVDRAQRAVAAASFQRPGDRRQHFAEVRQSIAVNVIENAVPHAG
jgi:hypothetical protein